MICYTHQDKQAVAICKNCFKAICEDCAIPNDYGFACSEKCHQEIIQYREMMEKSKTVYGLKPGRTPILPIFLISAGAPLFLLGIVNLMGGHLFGLFPLSSGLIFIVIGIVSYRNMKKTGIRT